MVIAWEAAVPPCACAVVAVATYVALVSLIYWTNLHSITAQTLFTCVQLNSNYWDLTFQSILGKLYVISLYVTL